MVKINSDLNFEQTDGRRALCGAYFIGEPDEVLSLEVHDARTQCDQGEFIEVINFLFITKNALTNIVTMDWLVKLSTSIIR